MPQTLRKYSLNNLQHSEKRSVIKGYRISKGSDLFEVSIIPWGCKTRTLSFQLSVLFVWRTVLALALGSVIVVLNWAMVGFLVKIFFETVLSKFKPTVSL